MLVPILVWCSEQRTSSAYQSPCFPSAAKGRPVLGERGRSWGWSYNELLSSALLTLGLVFLQTKGVGMASQTQPLQGGNRVSLEMAFKMGKKCLFFPNFKAELTDVKPGCKSAVWYSSVLHLCHLAEDMRTSGSCG